MELVYKAIMEEQESKALDEIKKSVSVLDAESYADDAGNIIFYKQGNGRKIMLLTIVNQLKLCISGVKENKAEFELCGSTELSSLKDEEVFISGSSVGIIRETKEEEKSKYFIELWDKNIVKIGDFCNIKSSYRCKDYKLYGINLSGLIPFEIAKKSFNQVKSSVNDIYFTVSFNENSAKAIIKKLCPDIIYLVYCVKETEDFKTSNGCGIVYKDGNAVIDKSLIDFIENTAKDSGISHQVYIGKQSNFPELLGITGKGATVGAFAVPVAYLGSGCELLNTEDIKSGSSLILNALNI